MFSEEDFEDLMKPSWIPTALLVMAGACFLLCVYFLID